MRWPWARRTRPEDVRAAEDAVEHADQAARRWPEVRRVTAEMASVRRDNHFAERMRRALESNP